MNSVPSGTPVAIPTEPSTCPVCHDDLYQPKNPEFAGKHVGIASPCGHKYHLNCLTLWTGANLECPYGRQVIENVTVEILTLPPNWQTRMVNAAKEGNIRIIRALLNRGASADAGQIAGKTPLVWAVNNKHLDAALLLADKGSSDPIGLNNLEQLYQHGDGGIPVDLCKAESFYLKAAELGDTSAMNNLGYLHQYGGEDFPVDLSKAESWYLKAAKLGSARAMNNLGYLYKQGGKDFPADLHKAESCYLQATELGNAAAMNNLGYLYQYGGQDFPADLHKAKHWYQQAVKLGSVSAMINLGCMFQEGGKDFPVDLYAAEGLYLQAAELGDATAMRCLGSLYKHGGEGFVADNEKSYMWYMKSLKQNNHLPQVELDGFDKNKIALILSRMIDLLDTNLKTQVQDLLKDKA
ncbi:MULTISPECIES: ankyrin repeat domain-containing protein [unclassified Endozoicomonas]|uniref:ankyrin repeat domain-containing protein n=1 Tax=unclassified Endozoicomonas TaxID=2644528 RepID=UPI003BB7CED9